MGIGDAARSQGDVMYRLQRLEDQIRDLQTARRLEAAAVGKGGLRVQGGRVLAQDGAGDKVFEVTTAPAGIFMREELISAVAVQVFADRIHTASVQPQQTTTSTSFTDLATAGPTVAGVDITTTGKALVFITSYINGAGNDEGYVGVQVSGATTIAPDTFRALALGNFLFGATDTDPTGAMTKIVNLTDLNPGLHTFQLKYRTATGNTIGFGDRVITVIAF